jgi:endonuclease III
LVYSERTMAKRPKTKTERVRHAGEVVARLERLYPEAECELDHVDRYQLLIATILSAQTTDRAVNEVTPALFRRYPMPADLAAADREEVAAMISTIGLYRNKAKSVVGAAGQLVALHGGEVPREREALEALPGVGRKTANVVLASGFGEPALAVDTHVTRLAQRLGLSASSEPRQIEEDLTSSLPPERWGFTSHALIWHGRRVCKARGPRCDECALVDVCPSAFLEASAEKKATAKKVGRRASG